MNAGEFRQWLLARQPPGLVHALWTSVFKIIGNQALVIDPPRETVPVATQLRGTYTTARWTGELGVLSPLKLLHFAWGRTAAEVRRKVENWRHARRSDAGGFMRLWESVTVEVLHGTDTVKW